MGCDYLIETSIIIEYYSKNGEICKIVTNTKKKRGFIDKNYKTKKIIKKLEKKMSKNCYIKMIYEDNKWLKDRYEEKYETKLKRWYPVIDKFIKIYKDSISWPVNRIAYY